MQYAKKLIFRFVSDDFSLIIRTFEYAFQKSLKLLTRLGMTNEALRVRPPKPNINGSNPLVGTDLPITSRI